MQYIGYMKTHTSIQAINRRTLSDQVYYSLRTAIISLELEPGQKISDMDLAEQFKLSLTPNREALKRLEKYGLIITIPVSATQGYIINHEYQTEQYDDMAYH